MNRTDSDENSRVNAKHKGDNERHAQEEHLFPSLVPEKISERDKKQANSLPSLSRGRRAHGTQSRSRRPP